MLRKAQLQAADLFFVGSTHPHTMTTQEVHRRMSRGVGKPSTFSEAAARTGDDDPRAAPSKRPRASRAAARTLDLATGGARQITPEQPGFPEHGSREAFADLLDSNQVLLRELGVR